MTDTIARLRITLSDTDPAIWRRIDVPVEASLKMLHDVIQGAMGWQDTIYGSSKPTNGAMGYPTLNGPMARWWRPRTPSSRR